MIFGKLLEKKIRKIYTKVIAKQGSDIFDYDQREKIVNNTIKTINIIATIGTAIFLIYFFNNIIVTKIGFEKTIITLLVVILSIRNFNN